MSLEDWELGQRLDLGSHAFTEEEIIRFARAYDPQPFHVDPEAARESHFGALCASGWHTCSIWMRQFVRKWQETRNDAGAASLGTPAGFRDLRWIKPVYVGDRLHFAATVLNTSALSAQPGFGLLECEATADNQDGSRVLLFVVDFVMPWR